MNRPFGPVALTLSAALLVWLLVSAHGIWSIDFQLGYLGERQPLYPTFTACYGAFFTDSLTMLTVFLIAGIPLLFLRGAARSPCR